MKKIIVPLLLFVFIGSCKKQITVNINEEQTSSAASPCTGNNWAGTANWPFWTAPDFIEFNRFQFVCGNKLYVPAKYDKMYIYDGVSWSVIDSDIPAYFNAGFCFAIGDKGYISPGGTGAGKKLWEYSTLTNTWTEKASFLGASRFWASSFVTGNKAYVTCGEYGSTYFHDLWEYSPLANQWTQKASQPANVTPRSRAASFVVAGKGYLACGTGLTPGNALLHVKTLVEYNPATNSWALKADFPGPGSADPIAFAIGSYGYAGTGASDFYRYSPATNSWSSIADYTCSGWQYNCAVTIGSKGYVLGDLSMCKYSPKVCVGSTP